MTTIVRRFPRLVIYNEAFGVVCKNDPVRVEDFMPLEVSHRIRLNEFEIFSDWRKSEPVRSSFTVDAAVRVKKRLFHDTPLQTPACENVSHGIRRFVRDLKDHDHEWQDDCKPEGPAQ